MHAKQIEDLKKTITSFANKLNQMKSGQAAAASDDKTAKGAKKEKQADFNIGNEELESRIEELERTVEYLKDEKVS